MEKIVVENSEILMFYVMKISFNSEVKVQLQNYPIIQYVLGIFYIQNLVYWTFSILKDANGKLPTTTRRLTKTSTHKNVDSQKRRLTKTSTHKNVHSQNVQNVDLHNVQNVDKTSTHKASNHKMSKFCIFTNCTGLQILTQLKL